MGTPEKPNIDRTGANRCFVCGPDNPSGLQLEFRLDGQVCRSEYTPAPDHIGFDDVVHGGLIFSALDDVMANWLFLSGERAVTAKCEVRFRVPTAPGAKLLLESRLLQRKGRVATLEGRAVTADGQILIADATATFVVTDKA